MNTMYKQTIKKCISIYNKSIYAREETSYANIKPILFRCHLIFKNICIDRYKYVVKEHRTNRSVFGITLQYCFNTIQQRINLK